MSSMTIKNARTETPMTIGEASRAALKIFRHESDATVLVAWHDRVRGRAGPMEVCDRQPFKVTLDYAASVGAHTRIHVDGGRYELFYGSIPPSAEELNYQACLEIHCDLEQDRYENVMGG